MLKTAILSDIHGNLPALGAVLHDVAESGAERIVFGGDIVGYGAHPMECLDLVRRLGGESVLGNHDEYTVRFSLQPGPLAQPGTDENPVLAGIAHAVRELDPGAIGWLRELPRMLRLDGPAVLAHASLHQPEEWHYLHDAGAAGPTLELLRRHRVGVGFFGHTHAQDIFFGADSRRVPEWLDERRIKLPEGSVCAVLVGSVGQPRGGDDARAGWTLWDPGNRIVEFRRVEYSAMEAALDILKAGLPACSAVRLLDASQQKLLVRVSREKGRAGT